MSHHFAASELSSERDLDDDGWLVCTSAATGAPISTLRDVLRGCAPLTALGEDAAVATLYRTRDQALIDAADLRPDVVQAAVDLSLDPPAGVTDSGALTDALTAELSGVGDLRGGLHCLYRALRAVWAAGGDTGVAAFAAALAKVLDSPGCAGPLDTRSFHHMFCVATRLLEHGDPAAIAPFVALVDDMEPVPAAAFIAAAEYLGFAEKHRPSSLEELATVLAALAAAGTPSSEVVAADATGVLGSGRLRGVVAARFVAAGGELFGPGSLAESWGFPDKVAELTDASARLLVVSARSNVAAASRFLELWTAGGTVRRPVPGLHLGGPGDDGASWRAVSWRAALAAVDPVAVAGDPGRFCAAALGWFAHLPSGEADEFLGAVTEAGDVFRDALVQSLPRELRFAGVEIRGALAELVDTSMGEVALGVWVEYSDVIRRRLLAAAAGIGEDRWSVLVGLLDTFRGTPEQLVELTAELAPSPAT